jgi:hypothetical protein
MRRRSTFSGRISVHADSAAMTAKRAIVGCSVHATCSIARCAPVQTPDGARVGLRSSIKSRGAAGATLALVVPERGQRRRSQDVHARRTAEAFRRHQHRRGRHVGDPNWSAARICALSLDAGSLRCTDRHLRRARHREADDS